MTALLEVVDVAVRCVEPELACARLITCHYPAGGSTTCSISIRLCVKHCASITALNRARVWRGADFVRLSAGVNLLVGLCSFYMQASTSPPIPFLAAGSLTFFMNPRVGFRLKVHITDGTVQLSKFVLASDHAAQRQAETQIVTGHN